MIKFKHARFVISITLFLACGLLLSGCSKTNEVSNLKASGKTYAITPGFNDFYSSLGGENVLGPAISPLFDFESLQCQYTVSSLLCLNPMLTGAERFSLYPLGNFLNVQENPGENPGGLVVNGYTVYDEFVPLFNRLSGETYAGKPISNVHLNYQLQRIEQYFENVGFYRQFSDSPSDIKLIAYGAASCTTECDYHAAQEAAIQNGSSEVTDQSMLEKLNRSDDLSVFGKPLTQVYLAADGMQEQIYETVILYSEENSDSVKLRPLPSLVNIETTEPTEKKPEKQEGLVFYSVGDGLGYYVPTLFDEFIDQHGGSLYSGNPITNAAQNEAGIVRQCFTNYCLEIAPAAEGAQVTLVPLGSQYLQQIQDAVAAQEPVELTTDTVELEISQSLSQISSAEVQKIDVFVYRKADQQPMAGIESELMLALPDGTTYYDTFPATQADGRSSITISPIKNIPNGSILTYQICLKSALTESLCKTGSYLVWDNPD